MTDRVLGSLKDGSKLYHLRVTKEEAEQHQKELADKLRNEFADKLWIVDLLNMKPRQPKVIKGGEAKPTAGASSSA